MTHEEAVERLHDAHLRTLSPETRAELDAHLAECAECRAMRRLLRKLKHVLEEDHHVLPEQIVALALHPESLGAPERAHVEAHLAHCESCSAELKRGREVERSVS